MNEVKEGIQLGKERRGAENKRDEWGRKIGKLPA